MSDRDKMRAERIERTDVRNTDDTAHELGERDEGRSAGDHSLVMIILRLNRNELDIYNTIFQRLTIRKGMSMIPVLGRGSGD